MSKRFDTKKLLYIFGALVVLLLLTVILKVPKEKATLKGLLLELDTAEVSKIVITPKYQEGEPFEFIRSENRWRIIQDNKTANPATGAIQNIFDEILALKPKSLAAVDKTKWKEFELTDSMATRVEFMNEKGRKLAGVLIGKFSYKQSPNPYNSYSGNNIEGTSYVRINDEKEIYAVDGFLAVSFSGQFSDWRDRSFIKSNKDDITEVSFRLPGDSSYVMVKKEKNWFIGSRQADSVSVSNYLNALSFIDGQEFRDGFIPVSNPEYQIVVQGNNLLNFTVKCYSAEGTDEFVLNSSLNPDVYYTSRRNGIFSQVIKPDTYFLKK